MDFARDSPPCAQNTRVVGWMPSRTEFDFEFTDASWILDGGYVAVRPVVLDDRNCCSDLEQLSLSIAQVRQNGSMLTGKS